ncbi:hypothetical protein C0J52_08736 [Blattella germanica]|nr:hypothetical protein C0J52_08736 [Blattella germanica]
MGAQNDNLGPKNRTQRRRMTEKKMGGRLKTQLRTQLDDNKSQGQTRMETNDRSSSETYLRIFPALAMRDCQNSHLASQEALAL